LSKNIKLEKRDFLILGLIHKFKFCLSRHIKVLAGFTGARATDRRLKLLVESGYLKRNKYLYGIPYLYTLTHKGRILLGTNKRENKIRIERITHDIHVIDALIYLMARWGISLDDIESERQLHIKDGFGARKHQPDFVANINNERYAVEIELHPKERTRLENNIRNNYLNFDYQVWITNDNRVLSMLSSFQNEYSNIEIINLKEVLNHNKH